MGLEGSGIEAKGTCGLPEGKAGAFVLCCGSESLIESPEVRDWGKDTKYREGKVIEC